MNNTAAKQNMTHLLHENDSDFPLVQKLLSVPRYKRIYLAHMKTILLENFDNGAYLNVGQSLQATIDAAVQADDNKFYTYNEFVSNLTTDIGSVGGPGGGPGGRSSTPGITSLMDARATYLLGLSDFTQVEPSISDISISNLAPVVDERITISTTVTEGTNVWLGYRNAAVTAPFTKVEMYDDGAHGDGASNDGVYGVELTITNTTTEYYIYAENDNIGMFSPRRAEYEYYSIDAISNLSSGPVVINEFMASNDVTVTDQDGEYEDWIELYNNDTVSIDLSGYFLTDDGLDLTQWSFPQGTSIAANGYLIVWADDDADQEGLHANFKLSASGESIVLASPVDTSIVDIIDYPAQTTDISYARIPNGTGDFQTAATTFNTNNDSVSDCTNAGGDMDNDGICAMDDCDDMDPLVGAIQPVGTACDDGNALTQNDVILADGCSCEGTIIALSDVVINEFMASNDVTVTDQDGEYEDWIELYNNGTASVDLSGYFLTDDASELTQWSFPQGTSIAPNGYLIVWADDDADQEGLHANFKLSASGESIVLASPVDTSIVDIIDYPAQTTDISYGRYPNGTGAFQTIDPTFNGENAIITSTEDVLAKNNALKVYPNPANDYFFLEYSNDLKEKLVTIFSMTGTIVYQNTVFDKTSVNTSDWIPGMYIISSEGTHFKLLVQ